MGVYGAMRTGVAGMAAQAERISAISDNIANSGTVGYKAAITAFSQIVSITDGEAYESGSVAVETLRSTTREGAAIASQEATNLAISGAGFFVVEGSGGAHLLTRAGNFVPDARGRLVNSGGNVLLGFPALPGTRSLEASNLEPVVVRPNRLSSIATTLAAIGANLPAGSEVVPAASLPSGNSVSASFTGKMHVQAWGSLGQPVGLDCYFAKTGANAWELSIFDAGDRDAGGGFPYSSSARLTTPVTFDASTGGLTSPSTAELVLSNGNSIEIDLSELTQFYTPFSAFKADANGRAPVQPSSFNVTPDGTLEYIYSDGSRQAAYMIPIASVGGGEQLTAVSGTAFGSNSSSGDALLHVAGEDGMGKINGSYLEQSNVDLSVELTNLITAQRDYTANSRVFQTGSEIMEIVVNLKR